MKYSFFKRLVVTFTVIAFSASLMAGCASSEDKGTSADRTSRTESPSINTLTDNTSPATELDVRFGDSGRPFTMHLYDNPTAAEIARDVGTTSWRLPIYHYDDYENWEVMQYYDIPSRYEIPSNPETVTSEKAGEVYYSDPNRIILFYKDAEVTGEYTKVGYFDYSDDFLSAVENNPVLEGWGNKLVLIEKGNR